MKFVISGELNLRIVREEVSIFFYNLTFFQKIIRHLHATFHFRNLKNFKNNDNMII